MSVLTTQEWNIWRGTMTRLRLPQVCVLLLAIASAVSIISFIVKVNTMGDLNCCDCNEADNNGKQLYSRVEPIGAASCENLPKNLFNIDEFTFIKNSSELCTHSGHDYDHGPLMVIIVHSAVNNFEKRDVIRATWGSVKKYGNWTFVIAFLLGAQSENSDDGAPVDGSDSDVIIGDFIDSYRNLTYKHLAGYKWVGEHCPHANYILKIDDDVILDIFHLTKLVENYEQHELEQKWSLLGNLMSGYGPERASDSKAVISVSEYPGESYPDYVSGLAYIIETPAACDVYKSHVGKPYLWIDDVFVTGILREPLNLPIRDISDEYFFPVMPMDYPRLWSWYTTIEDTNPPPFMVILHLDLPEQDMPGLGSNMWEVFSKVWAKTMRSYGVRPGHGFND